MMSAHFRGVSSERADTRRSRSRDAASVDASESWLSRASAQDVQQVVVVAHQAHELWFNQLLCELAVLVADLDADILPAASRTLERTSRIAGVLVEQMLELRALSEGGRGQLHALLAGKTAAQPLRRLERIAGTGAAVSGRWIARERRPERPRSASVREAFLRAVAREPRGDAEVELARTPALAELQTWLAARLACPGAAARRELAGGLRGLDDQLVEWARQRDLLYAGPRDAERRAGTAPARRFFPELAA